MSLFCPVHYGTTSETSTRDNPTVHIACEDRDVPVQIVTNSMGMDQWWCGSPQALSVTRQR